MTKLVLVETISQYRIRYVVELADDAPNEYACDDVVMADAGGEYELKEFSQRHIGESILSHREITKEEYLKTFNEDNEYLAAWTNDQKFGFINKPK